MRSAFTTAEVDQLPEIRAPFFPAYPEQLQRSGVSGEVIVEYVVLMEEMVDSASVRVIASTDQAFTKSVIKAVLSASFTPRAAVGRAGIGSGAADDSVPEPLIRL